MLMISSRFSSLGFDETHILMLRPEGLDVHRHRIRHADGVCDLDFRLVSVTGQHDVPGNLPRHVCAAALHLTSVRMVG